MQVQGHARLEIWSVQWPLVAEKLLESFENFRRLTWKVLFGPMFYVSLRATFQAEHISWVCLFWTARIRGSLGEYLLLKRGLQGSISILLIIRIWTMCYWQETLTKQHMKQH